MELDSEMKMLHAISILGKAKAMKRTSKPLALIELSRAASLMNKSIKLDPENIEIRKYRLRHLMGVTMNSPKSYIKEVEEDFSFLKSRIPDLNSEDMSYYLSALGEYEIYKGNVDEGIKILTDVIENYKYSTMYEYTKAYLDTVLSNT